MYLFFSDVILFVKAISKYILLLLRFFIITHLALLKAIQTTLLWITQKCVNSMWRANFKILNLKSKFFAQNIFLNQIYKLVCNNCNNFCRGLIARQFLCVCYKIFFKVILILKWIRTSVKNLSGWWRLTVQAKDFTKGALSSRALNICFTWYIP